MMLNITQVLIAEVADKLETTFHALFGATDLEYLESGKQACSRALTHIGTSDALYHNVEHTARVTLVGVQVLLGKQTREHSVTPHHWLNTVVALACHDIGYVRGICRADDGDQLATGIARQTTQISAGRSDAALMPLHVDRGKLFVEQSVTASDLIDVPFIQACIERTRFPVPSEAWYQLTDDYPGLVRGADLIGQLSDPAYLSKLPAVFYEFVEVGFNESMGYKEPGDLLAAYPSFFEQSVEPYIGPTVDCLDATPGGREILDSLYGNLKAAAQPEHLVLAV